MSVERTPNPSPFTGEVAERSEAGEGSWNPGRRGPSPGRSRLVIELSNLEGVVAMLAQALQAERLR